MKLEDFKRLHAARGGKSPKEEEEVGGEVMVSDVAMVGANAESPFASYEADASKAFIEFTICHSFPSYAGPVAMGPGVANYTSFFPSTLERSYGSLTHQQLNLRHLLRVYGSEEKPIANDRIIGCIVATTLSARKPMGGWRVPGSKVEGRESKDYDACAIRACAVVFKMAAGVGKMIGDHVTGRESQSVSIETATQMNNLGVYRPSTDELVPLCEPTEEIFQAYKEVEGNNMPLIGKIGDEQLFVMYGLDKPVHFRGVGVTPIPAERDAEIVNLVAEIEGRRSQAQEESWIEEKDGMIAIAAENVLGATVHLLAGRKVTFKRGRTGEIKTVHTQGKIRLPGQPWTREATAAEPVLEVEMPDAKRVLRHYSELVEMVH